MGTIIIYLFLVLGWGLFLYVIIKKEVKEKEKIKLIEKQRKIIAELIEKLKKG